MKDRLMQLLKEPLLQFLIIGAGIYAAYAVYGPPDEMLDDRIIEVDAAQLDVFISEWERRWNRPPTRQELDGVIDSYVRENILYQQALAMGLNEGDPITRRRMAQKLEFLTNDLALLKQPGDGELEQFFTDHLERYREEDLITFSHVYLDPDARDATTLDDAAAMLAELVAAGEPDAQTLVAGDRFMLESYYPQATELEVRRRFGTGFSDSLMQLEAGQWHGPVLSGYGVHLVYIYALNEAPAPAFEDVRQAVLQDWQQAQQEQFNADFFSGLKSTYDISIAEPPADRILQRSPQGKVDAADGSAASAPVAELAPVAKSEPES